MAQQLTPSFSDPRDLLGTQPKAAPFNDGEVTWGDRGNQFLAAGSGMLGDVAALIDRYTDSDTAREWEKSFVDAQRRFTDSLSPAAREEFEAALFPTETGSSSIFSTKSGMRSAITGKIVQMLPGIIPAIGAAVVAPEAAVAGTAAAIFGLQGAGAVVRSTREYIDSIEDGELRQRVPEYDQLRQSMDEPTARKVVADHILGYAPELTGIAVGLATVATGGGAAGVIRGAVRGGSQAGKGVIGGAASGAMRSGGENAIQELAQAVGEAAPLSTSGLKDASAAEIAGRTAEGGVMGALFGVVPGAAEGVRARREAAKAGKVPVVPEAGPDPAQAAALGATTESNPPAPPAPPVNPPKQEAPPFAPKTDEQIMREGVEATQEPTAPPVVDDTAATIPETRSTFEAQVADLVNPENERRAVLLPSIPKEGGKGYTHVAKSDRPKLPEGMKSVTMPEGIYYYDPKRTNVDEIKKLRKEGRTNELFGMADTTKADAIGDVANGADPVALTVRDEAGVPKVDQFTSTDRVDADAQQLAAKANPTDTVEARPTDAVAGERAANAETEFDKKLDAKVAEVGAKAPAQPGVGPKGAEAVSKRKGKKPTEAEAREAEITRMIDELAARQSGGEPTARFGEAQRGVAEPSNADLGARFSGRFTETGGRIFETTEGGMSAADQDAAVRANLKAGPKEKPGKGKKWTKKEREARAKENEIAEKTVAPLAKEATEDYASKDPVERKNARQAIRERAQAMVDAAKAAGLDVNNIKRVKDSIDATMNQNQWVALLTEAKRLLGRIDLRKVEGKDFGSFVLQEQLAKGGIESRDVMVAKMREEGQAAKRKQKEAVTKDGEVRDEVDIAEAAAAQTQTRVDEDAVIAAIDAKRALEKGIDPKEVEEVENAEGRVKRVAIAERAKPKSEGLKAEDAAKVEAAKKAAEEKRAAEKAEKEAAKQRAKELGIKDEGGIAKADEIRVIDPNSEEGRAIAAAANAPVKAEPLPADPLKAEVERLRADMAKFGMVMDDAALERQAKNNLAKRKENASVDDMGDPLKVEADRVRAGIEGKNVFEVAGWLEKNAPKGYQRNVARRVRIMMEKLAAAGMKYDFKIVNPGDMAPRGGWRGFAHYEFGGGKQRMTIYIASADLTGRSGMSYQTVLHELVHGALMSAVQMGNRRFAASSELGKVIGNLYDVHRAVINYFNDRARKGELNEFEKAYFERRNNSLADPDELLAWALTNERMQEWLNTIPYDGKQSVMRRILNILAELFGIKSNDKTALREVLKIADSLLDEDTNRVTNQVTDIFEKYTSLTSNPAQALRGMESVERAQISMDRVKENAADVVTNTKGWLARMGDALKSTAMIVRSMEEGVFAGLKAPRDIWIARRAIDTMRAELLEKAGGKELIEKHVALQKADPDTYARMVDIGYRFTRLDANPGGEAANPHFGSDKTKYWQAKAQVGKLDAELADLKQEYRDLILDTSATFKSIQNAVSLKEIQNVLDKLGVKEPGLAERIHTDTATEADYKLFKSNAALKALNDAQGFKKLNGLYLPQMRRGDFIVSGRIPLKVPADAIQTDSDTLLFVSKGNNAKLRRDVEAWAGQQELKHTSTRQIWVDKNDPTKQVEKEDTNAVLAYRVRVQTQFTEFVGDRASAFKLAEEMRAKGLEDVFTEAREQSLYQQKNVHSPDMDRLADAMKKDEKFRNLDEEGQASVLQTLREAGLRMSGDNSLALRKLYRRNVEGFSKDLVANTQEYLGQAAGYLARLNYQPKIDAGFKELSDYMKANRYTSDSVATRRREEFDLLKQRIYAPEYDERTDTKFGQFSRRLLQASSLNKLASPGYHIVNAHEPITTAMPYLMGRHKVGNVLGTMRRAYSMLGAGDAVMKGIKDTGLAFMQDSGFTNYQDFFLANLSRNGVDNARLARIKDMFDELHKAGLFDREAGFEVTRVDDPTSNALGRFADRADLMTRQVGVAIEAINRGVTSLAAYELEFARTKNHEAAKRYAFEAVHDTMGDYSNTNAAPIFRNPAGKLAFQFKKFAQKQYWLLGRSFRGMLAGDPEKAKQFVGLMVTHGLVAGALGLPLEPIKLALLASNALGIVGVTYEDFENMVRETAASTLGKEGGELFTKGLYRGIGIDMSSRLGIDSMLTFGAPRSNKTQDWKSWLFDTVAGAPGGLLLQQIEVGQALMDGNKAMGDRLLNAAEKFAYTPKIGVDIIRATKGIEGKENARGQQVLTPYSPVEAGVRVLGFTPAREAEQGAMRGRVGSESRQQWEQRQKLTQAWVSAKPDERARIWGRVEKFNQDQPKDARITRADLDRAVKRRQTELKEGTLVNGMRVNKNTQGIYDAAARTYNTRN